MKHSRRNRLVAAALVVGGFLSIASAQAFAAGALHASPANGLTQGEVVRVAGSGLAAHTYGYVLECNSAPGEPTVYVGAPFDHTVPVGCSRPSLKYIVSTSSGGTLSATIRVHVSRNLGPPCSVYSVFGPCGGRPDSAGKGPRADAQNYPCPPSPAQQAAGVTCSLVFYDTAQQLLSTPIKFLGSGPATKTPPATVPTPTPTPTPGTPPGTTHTPPGTTTSPGGGSSPGSGTAPGSPTLTGSTGGGSGGSSTDPGSTGSGIVTANSGSLAFTGLGATGKLLALLGAFFVLVGLVLLFVNVRRVGVWLLGL